MVLTRILKFIYHCKYEIYVAEAKFCFEQFNIFEVSTEAQRKTYYYTNVLM